MKRILLTAAILVMGAGFGLAQTVTGNEFQTQQTGKAVPGMVQMCINASNVAVPCGTTTAERSQQLGSSSFAASQATASTTASSIVAARTGRMAVTIENNGTTPVYLGATSAVTSTTGFLLPGVVGASITIPTQGQLFAIVGTGTQAVSILETY